VSFHANMAGPRAAGEGEGQRDAEGLEMASAAVDAPGEKKSTQEQGEATGAALQKNLDNKVPPPPSQHTDTVTTTQAASLRIGEAG